MARRKRAVLLAVLGGCADTAAHEGQASARAALESEAQAMLTTEQKLSADHLVGSYAFVGGQAERDALAKALDDVVADMNLVIRPIARGRLEKSNPIPGTVRIELDGETLTLRLDSRTYTARLGAGSTTVEGLDGSKLSMRFDMQGDLLIQTFKGDQGGRKNTWSPADDKLRLKVQVDSDKLPKPLKYRLTFERNDP